MNKLVKKELFSADNEIKGVLLLQRNLPVKILFIMTAMVRPSI